MKTFFTVHVIAEFKNKFLILRRASNRSNPGTWNYVTGHIKERESAEDAAIRELKEETNLSGKITTSSLPFWIDDNNTRWVVTAVTMKIDNIDSLIIDKNESDEFQWIDTNQIKEYLKNHPIYITAKKLKLFKTKKLGCGITLTRQSLSRELYNKQ